MSDWTPIEDPTPNPFNERMKNYKQPFNLPGFLSLLFMVIVIISFVTMLIVLFPIAIRIPPVSTPVAEWTNVP